MLRKKIHFELYFIRRNDKIKNKKTTIKKKWNRGGNIGLGFWRRHCHESNIESILLYDLKVVFLFLKIEN